MKQGKNFPLFFFGFCILILLVKVISVGYENAERRDDMARRLISDQFANVNWYSESTSEYKLIRPLEFDSNAVDAYGIGLKPYEWYLISSRNGFFPLPVVGGQGFVTNKTNLNKIAIIDTVEAELIFLRGGSNYQGLINVKRIAVLCFKDKKVYPYYCESGMIEIGIKDK